MHGPHGLRVRDGSPVLHPLALPDGPHLALTFGVGPAVTSSVILSCTSPAVDAPGERTVTQVAQRSLANRENITLEQATRMCIFRGALTYEAEWSEDAQQ
jgi:hypothetical protein